MSKRLKLYKMKMKYVTGCVWLFRIRFRFEKLDGDSAV